MELLSVENVTFRYPSADSDALRGVSLSVSEGQWAVLCGLSGCGKSTLLKLIKREIAPFGQMSGRILFAGKDTRKKSASAGRASSSSASHASSSYANRTDEAKTELEFLSDREAAEGIGIVMQDPEAQIVTDEVWHELAFGLENLGLTSETIRRRVAEMASFFGIEDWYHKKTFELSGGQKQLLNLASTLVMNPRLLLLDEPTAQLDPIAANEFRNVLTRINRDLGVTILMAEHRLEEVMPLADRIIVMRDREDRALARTEETAAGTFCSAADAGTFGSTCDADGNDHGGSVLFSGTPEEAARYLNAHSHPMAAALPSATRVYFALTGGDIGRGETLPAGDTAIPFTVRDGRILLSDFTDAAIDRPQSAGNGNRPTVLEARDVRFRYAKQSPDVLSGASFTLREGEHYCLLGGNGSGKTTLLSLLAGLAKPYAGSIRLCGRKLSSFGPGELYRNNLALLPQQPRDVFVEKTIREDLLKAFFRANSSSDNSKERSDTGKENSDTSAEAAMTRMCERLRIADILDSHPYDVSGGELQKAALAKVLASRPKVLLLDEPAKGIDVRGKRELAELLDELRGEGMAVISVTHDAEWAAAHADRCGLLFDGEIISEGEPGAFFADNAFYTTAANRMTRGIIDGAVVLDDVIRAVFGRNPGNTPGGDVPGSSASRDNIRGNKNFRDNDASDVREEVTP